MDKIFLSNTNFNILLQIVNEKLVEEYPNCIQNKSLQENFKKQLEARIGQIYKDRNTFDIPCDQKDRNYIRYLNEHVLDFIIPQFKNILKQFSTKKLKNLRNNVHNDKTRVNKYSQVSQQNVTVLRDFTLKINFNN